MKAMRALLPWLAIALAFAGVAAGIHAAFTSTYQRGHAAGADSVHRQWSDHRAASALKEAELQAYHRAREQTLVLRLDQLDQSNHEELQRVENEKAAFIAGVRAGRIRLSIPVAHAAACNAHHSAASADPAAAAEPAETRAELAPAAAQSLVAIADDGDTAIRDLNTCIDRYNTVRTTLNHDVQSP
ncbi:lysis system i-spanin subunit Rz [Hydrogenophaga sp.]|uniref:lysis system i-spanin subunit Rz n=1 Tax=Hydrogenophaga sp. TaxID=1904254 RepID=UPI003F72073D